MIPIYDTHRLTYKNSKIYAISYEDGTTRLDFFAPSSNSDDDPVNVGDTLYTNSNGDITSGSGTSLSSGYFVAERATIFVTDFSDQHLVQWVTTAGQTEVGDGKLLGEGDVTVMSANQSDNTDFDYTKLKNKPSISSWKEREATYSVSTWGEEVTVDEWTTVLKIRAKESCLKNATCGYRMCIKLNGPTRPGQQLFIVSETLSDVNILNSWNDVPGSSDENQYDNSITVLNGFEGVALAGESYGIDDDGNSTYKWRATSQTSLANPPTIAGGNSDGDTVQYVEISDVSGVASYNVRSTTKVIVCTDITPDYTILQLQLKFSRVGQRVIVINNGTKILHLYNSYPSDSTETEAKEHCCFYVNASDGVTDSSVSRSVGVLGTATIGGSDAIRFWGFADKDEYTASDVVRNIQEAKFVVSGRMATGDGINSEIYVKSSSDHSSGYSDGADDDGNYVATAESPIWATNRTTIELGTIDLQKTTTSLRIIIELDDDLIIHNADDDGCIYFHAYIQGGTVGQNVQLLTPIIENGLQFSKNINEADDGSKSHISFGTMCIGQRFVWHKWDTDAGTSTYEPFVNHASTVADLPINDYSYSENNGTGYESQRSSSDVEHLQTAASNVPLVVDDVSAEYQKTYPDGGYADGSYHSTVYPYDIYNISSGYYKTNHISMPVTGTIGACNEAFVE